MSSSRTTFADIRVLRAIPGNFGLTCEMATAGTRFLCADRAGGTGGEGAGEELSVLAGAIGDLRCRFLFSGRAGGSRVFDGQAVPVFREPHVARPEAADGATCGSAGFPLWQAPD